VDKIVGPGNRYVAVAKARVSGDCDRFYAGPTEIVIVAGSGRPAWIAADLVAQAEHDPEARSIFITWSRALAARVADSVARQEAGHDIVKRSLGAHGAAIVTRSADEAMALANRIAPEHLVVDQSRSRGDRSRRARCSSARLRRRRPATTRPVRTTFCRRRARHGFAEGCRPPISCASWPCNA
jgi:histidinol dehydrogenase